LSLPPARSPLVFFQLLNPFFEFLPRLWIAVWINVAGCVVNVLIYSRLLRYQI